MRVNAITVMVVLTLLTGLGLTAQSSQPAEPTSMSTAPAVDRNPPVKGQTPAPAWPVSFVDTALPSIRVSTPERLTFTLLLANAGADAEPVTIGVPLRSSSGAALETKVGCTTDGKVQTGNESACRTQLPANMPVVPVTITVTAANTPRDAYPLNGVVIARPAVDSGWSMALPRATLALSGIGLDSAPAQDWDIIAGSAGLAALVVTAGFIACSALWGRWLLTTRMGSATFSFTDSWSNALMVGGPLLTAFLTNFIAFPEHAHTMSKRSYLLLSLLLSALIALGPAIFNLVKLPTRVEKPDGTATTQNQGLVVFFFLAAIVALTGGFGQLRLLVYVLTDLTSAAFLSESLGNGLVSVSNLLFWLVFVASIVSLVTTVAAATARHTPTTGAPAIPAPAPAKAASALQNALNAAPAQSGSTPLPTWSLP